MRRLILFLLILLAACSPAANPTVVPSETAEATPEATVEETAEVTAEPTLSDGEIQLTEVLETATEHFAQVATNQQLLVEVGGTATQHSQNSTATADYFGTETSAIATQRAALFSPTPVPILPTSIPTWTSIPPTPLPNVVAGLICRNGGIKFEVLDVINDGLSPLLFYSDGAGLQATGNQFANEFGFCAYLERTDGSGTRYLVGYGIDDTDNNLTEAGWIQVQNIVGLGNLIFNRAPTWDADLAYRQD